MGMPGRSKGLTSAASRPLLGGFIERHPHPVSHPDPALLPPARAPLGATHRTMLSPQLATRIPETACPDEVPPPAGLPPRRTHDRAERSCGRTAPPGSDGE